MLFKSLKTALFFLFLFFFSYFFSQRQADNFIMPVVAHTHAAYLQDKFAKLFESAQTKGTENTQDC